MHNYYSSPRRELLSCMGFFQHLPEGQRRVWRCRCPCSGANISKRVNWVTATAMTGFHVGAIAALFYIDAGAIVAAVVLWIVAGMLGIGMGYHRLLTHRGYKTPRWVDTS